MLRQGRKPIRRRGGAEKSLNVEIQLERPREAWSVRMRPSPSAVCFLETRRGTAPQVGLRVSEWSSRPSWLSEAALTSADTNGLGQAVRAIRVDFRGIGARTTVRFEGRGGVALNGAVFAGRSF